MSLSICMVTRDAERSIGRLLRSVAPLRAEVVVADTGSRDGTVQVARSLGASVRGIAWQDDFAAAQNLALDRATGDWVLWLNPDEEVLPAGLAHLPDLLARPDAFAYVVRIQEVMDPERPDGSNCQRFQTRLYIVRGLVASRCSDAAQRCRPHARQPARQKTLACKQAYTLWCQLLVWFCRASLPQWQSRSRSITCLDRYQNPARCSV